MIIAFDVETTGLCHYKGAEIFALSICTETYEQYYWEWPVCLKTRKVNHATNATDLKLLADFLCNPEIEKVNHNIKYDITKVKHSLGIEIQGKINDTLIAAKCIKSNENSYALKDLITKYQKYLDIAILPKQSESLLREEVDKYRKQAKKLNYSIAKSAKADYWLPKAMGSKYNRCRTYCLNDSLFAMKYWQFLDQGLDKMHVRHTYYKEMQLYPIVMAMEERGTRIDDKKCLEIMADCNRKMEAAKTKVLTYTKNKTLNLNSPKQLIPFLYDEIKLPVSKRTPTGFPSTDASVLRKHKANPAIQSLLEYLGADTGLGFFKNYLNHAVKDTLISINDFPNINRLCLHPSFNQWGAGHGRFSSSEPNLQNVPNEETSSGENVVNVRPVFIPREGYCWIIIDYKQLELRIFASRAKETTMINAFLAGRDIHDEVRKKVSVLAALPEGKGRKIAKNINFLKVNGGGAFTLSEKYDVPLQEAKEFLNAYDREYPICNMQISKMADYGASNGFIINAYGRRINIDSERAWTTASSYDIAGSAADLIKSAMIKCSDFFISMNYDAHIILQVHDELVFEVKKELATKRFVRHIKDLMEDNENRFSLPTPVDVSYTLTGWSNKTKVEC